MHARKQKKKRRNALRKKVVEKAKPRCSTNKDRLSELPLSIKHHILSLLPSDEAMATTMLSTAWRDVWIGLPVLDLGSTIFNKLRRPLETCGLFQQFLSFAKRSIRKRGSSGMVSVQKLNLYIPWEERMHMSADSIDDYFVPMNSCVNLAFAKLLVDELKVEFGFQQRYDEYSPRYYDYYYNLPTSVLSLANCLPLKRLELKSVSFDLETLDILAETCPSLEVLKFSSCRPLDNFIVEFPNLTEFVLIDDNSANLVVFAPDLRLFHYKMSGYYPRSGLINLAACENLKALHIEGTVGSRLVHISINSSTAYANFAISSDTLEYLHLSNVAINEYEINAPNLRTFCYEGRSSPLKFMMNHSALQEATITLDKNCYSGTYEYTTVINEQELDFVQKFSPCAMLILGQELIIPQDLQDSRSSSLLDVNHVILKHSKSDICAIVDSLLWLCPYASAISLEDRNINFKLKYNNESDWVEPYQWKHDLKEVTIEHQNTEENKGRAKLVKAFFRNARDRKKILVRIEDIELVNGST